MKQNRVKQVLANLRNRGLSQMAVSDPVPIYYLTGRWVDPGDTGVCIENLVLVTETGCKILNSYIKERKVIE